jgi:hypothetical protein
MILFIDLLMEKSQDRSKKESIKKTFHTYSCYFIVKFKKKINRVQAVERIRAIKSVTIVDLRGDKMLDKINQSLVEYEYSSVEVKFITNKPPEKEIEDIKIAMIKSDLKKGDHKIIGIVAAKAKLETLKKID